MLLPKFLLSPFIPDKKKSSSLQTSSADKRALWDGGTDPFKNPVAPSLTYSGTIFCGDRKLVKDKIWVTDFENPKADGSLERMDGAFEKISVGKFLASDDRRDTQVDVVGLTGIATRQGETWALPILDPSLFTLVSYDGPGHLKVSDKGTFLICDIPIGEHKISYRIEQRAQQIPLFVNQGTLIQTPDRPLLAPTRLGLNLARRESDIRKKIQWVNRILKANHGIYTVDPIVRALMQTRPAKGLTVLEMLQCFDCDTGSYYYAHLLRNTGAAACTAKGLVTQEGTTGEFTMVLSPGHAIPIAIDQKGFGHEIEMTEMLLNSKEPIEICGLGTRFMLLWSGSSQHRNFERKLRRTSNHLIASVTKQSSVRTPEDEVVSPLTQKESNEPQKQIDPLELLNDYNAHTTYAGTTQEGLPQTGQALLENLHSLTKAVSKRVAQTAFQRKDIQTYAAITEAKVLDQKRAYKAALRYIFDGNDGSEKKTSRP